MATKQDFVTWVGEQLQQRGWSQAELARRGGFSTGALSRIMNRERMPGVETCQAIARAFNMRDTDVMKIAGLAASTSPDDQAPSLRELISKFSQLGDEDQEAVLKHVRAMRGPRRRPPLMQNWTLSGPTSRGRRISGRLCGLTIRRWLPGGRNERR